MLPAVTPLVAIAAIAAQTPTLTPEQVKSRLRNCLDATNLSYTASTSGLLPRTTNPLCRSSVVR